MAVPFKAGCQNMTDFIERLEPRPVGAISGGVKKQVDTTFISSLIISFTIFRQKEIPSVHFL